MQNWHPGMLLSTSGDCPGSGMTSLTSNGPSLVKSELMSSVARHSGDEVDPAADPTMNTCARSACRTPPVPGLILVSSGVGGIVGTADPSVTGTTTGVAADVGTGSGGGSFRDSQCPPSSSRTVSETGEIPCIHANPESSGTVYPGDSTTFSKAGVAGAIPLSV